LGALVFTVLHFVDAQKDSFDLHLILGATQALARHLDPYIAWLNFKNGSAVDPGYEAQYPPSTYVLLLPLLLISWSSITIMLATANIGAGALLIALLRRQFLPDFGVARTFSIGAAFFLSMPFQANLLHGQISLLALAAFLLARNALIRGRFALGVLWLVCALAKPTVTLPLALALWSRTQIWAMVCASLTHIALFLAAAAWLGETPPTLLAHLMEAESYSLLAGFMNYSNILSSFGTDYGRAGLFISDAILIIMAALTFLRRDGDPLLLLSLAAVTSALCIYHSSYDMMLFVFPLAYISAVLVRKPFGKQTLLMQSTIILLGFTIALVWFAIEPIDKYLPMLATNRLGTHYFSGPHVVPLWGILMISASLALILLFVQTFLDKGWRADHVGD